MTGPYAFEEYERDVSADERYDDGRPSRREAEGDER